MAGRGRWTLSCSAAADHTPEGAEELTSQAFEYGLGLLLAGLRLRLPT